MKKEPLQIDPAVPIPIAYKGARSINARTVLAMADGDSVFQPTLQRAQTFRDCLRYYGFQALIRRRYQDEHGEEGYRIWKKIPERIEDAAEDQSKGKNALHRAIATVRQPIHPRIAEQGREDADDNGVSKGNRGAKKSRVKKGPPEEGPNL